MTLDELWNGLRWAYVRGGEVRGEEGGAARSASGTVGDVSGSVFTRILSSGLDDIETHIVHRGSSVFAILNS
ncbi:MAG: hypothetical protein ACKOQ1_03310 [Actinomycetota bacterium]